MGAVTNMTTMKIFVTCLIILFLFNLGFYILGVSTYLLSWSVIFGLFTTLGIIAVAISVLPIVDSESAVQWFVSIVFVVALLYSVNLNILTYNFPVGIGLATHVIEVFDSDPEALSFLPWLFFNGVGLIGVLSGILTMVGGDSA
jgi:hypothetical protein